jgi:hypothetical protein
MRGSNKAMSRMENAPSRIEIARMMAAITELFCASYRRPPSAIVLDMVFAPYRVDARRIKDVAIG